MPDSSEAALANLHRFLTSVVPDDARADIGPPIATLRTIVSLRAGQQHHGAMTRLVKSLTDLGLPYPSDDWQQTWDLVAGRTVQSLDALREAIVRINEG